MDESKMSSLPHIDECRYLILKIVEQSVRDFLSLSKSAAPIEQHYHETAQDFIFDPTYSIDYGGSIKTLSDLLDILDLDIEWFRVRVMRLKDRRIREFEIKRMLRDEYK